MRLGTYLSRVRSGQRLIVTDRHRPVAELRRIDTAPSSPRERLAQLAATGRVTAPSRRIGKFAPVKIAGESLVTTIVRDREDRF